MTRRSRNPFTNRILIGAITVLVAIVAVFLAYNANSGLPFVPTYNINVELPDAAGLIATDSVLVGGSRIGYIGQITAAQEAGGRNVAVLHLRLNQSAPRIPVDSSDLVRPVSPLGLKYLEITLGRSRRTVPRGGTIPASHTHLPVEIDDFFNIFNPPTRAASRADLNIYGDGFAGRGGDLNNFFAGIKPLVDHLGPAMRNLLDPRTRWAELFPSLEQAAHEVAPVAQEQADLFSALSRSFTPLSEATPQLQAAIAGGPPALQTATQQLPQEAQFTDDTAELFRRFRPAFVTLANASVQFAPAVKVGVPALARAPALNGRLSATLAAIQRFAGSSATLPGLELLTETAQLIEPTIAFAAPAQTSCNYLALFFRNLESALSESDSVGSMLRVTALPLPQLPNSEAGPASAPADGPPASGNSFQHSVEDDSYLHSDPYPNTDAPGQPTGCEAGNEVYLRQRVMVGQAPINQKQTEQTKRVLP
jgi:phospholipid/cholesterol/gamma-HCH transport system substrate-binding protein